MCVCDGFHVVLSLQFLIGYNRGLIVLWDNKESKTEQTYNATQVSASRWSVELGSGHLCHDSQVKLF